MKKVWAKMALLGHGYIDYINNPPTVLVNKPREVSD